MGFISDPDATVSRFGVLGIANLAVSRDTHQELFDVGAVAAMVTCCNSTDLQTRRAVAFGFNNISSNPANHTACERLGIIRQLCKLLEDHTTRTHICRPLWLFVGCAVESARCRNQITEMGGMASQLSSTLATRKMWRNLSLSEASKVAIVRQGGLGVICDMMHSPDVEICHQSAGVVCPRALKTKHSW